MKAWLLAVPAVLITAALSFGQSQSPAPAVPQQGQGQTQVMGRGRGGAPLAWNDRNKDGICDVTGQPVGQGRAAGFGRGRGGRCRAGFAAGRAGRGAWGRGVAPAPVTPRK